jgi:hypothetical protein
LISRNPFVCKKTFEKQLALNATCLPTATRLQLIATSDLSAEFPQLKKLLKTNQLATVAR